LSESERERRRRQNKKAFRHGVKSYMDSSFIASQVFNYLMSLTEIKIAAIYSVS